jgi:hypothetical protein
LVESLDEGLLVVRTVHVVEGSQEVFPHGVHIRGQNAMLIVDYCLELHPIVTIPDGCHGELLRVQPMDNVRSSGLTSLLDVRLVGIFPKPHRGPPVQVAYYVSAPLFVVGLRALWIAGIVGDTPR